MLEKKHNNSNQKNDCILKNFQNLNNNPNKFNKGCIRMKEENKNAISTSICINDAYLKKSKEKSVLYNKNDVLIETENIMLLKKIRFIEKSSEVLIFKKNKLNYNSIASKIQKYFNLNYKIKKISQFTTYSDSLQLLSNKINNNLISKLDVEPLSNSFSLINSKSIYESESVNDYKYDPKRRRILNKLIRYISNKRNIFITSYLKTKSYFILIEKFKYMYYHANLSNLQNKQRINSTFVIFKLITSMVKLRMKLFLDMIKLDSILLFNLKRNKLYLDNIYIYIYIIL